MTGLRVGFTGSREGMTSQQRQTVVRLVGQWRGSFHHGDCLGADVQAAQDAHRWYEVVAHPPTSEKHRGYGVADQIREPKPYMARNREIVDETDRLIAAPRQFREPPGRSGGGTWATIRYARKRGKRVIIVRPDGTYEEE